MNKKTALTLHRLTVYLDQGPGSNSMPIGNCAWIPYSQTAAFEWSSEARAAGLELSPLMMPLAPGVHQGSNDPFNGLLPLFSDSIPDGFGLRLMNKGLGLAGHNLAEVTPLHRLAWVGDRGVGALAYKPAIDGKVDPMLTTLFEAASLAAQAEAENFTDLPKAAIRAGGSALGARPKFWGAIGPDESKIVLGDQPKVPTGFTPVLLKFAPTGGDQDEPFFEAACLELARKHGVHAACGHLMIHPGGAALAIDRFDRLPSGQRIHTQTVAALLGLNFREPNLDYVVLAKLTRKIGTQADMERLYRQLCFNVALSMRDDHARNFAFCMDGTGHWALSPAFDLCPSEGIGFTREHTTTLNGKGTSISRYDLEAFAASQGIATSIAKEGIDSARAAAVEFKSLAIALGSTKAGANKWDKAFKAIDAHLQPTMIASPRPTSPAKKSKPNKGNGRAH
jgi:serine/threonine-protein kinase HipA